MMRQKVALVTAGSRGVGAAIARALAIDAEMRVVINYHSDAQQANGLVNELTRRHQLQNNNALPSSSAAPMYAAIQADMAQRSEITRLVDETVAMMGRLDVVVSNAGWTRMTDLMDLEQAQDEGDWDRCFNVNVKSHFFLFSACRAHLARNEGAFISTASVAGVKPSGSSLPYAVTKAALIHLTKTLAAIAAPQIRVNSVAPGVLLTDWGRQFSPAALEGVRAKNALGRFATVEDVAEQVKSLAVNRSITGQNIVLDAGFKI